MNARVRVADRYKKNVRARILQLFASGWVFCLSGCTGGFETDPLVEYSTEINLDGDTPETVSRQLRAGVYLIEVRERDIDLRVRVDAGTVHTRLADAYLRHGLHRTVVSLDGPQTLRVTLTSIDQRSWRGAAALRILRWPRGANPREGNDAHPDERLLGFIALGRGTELVAGGTKESWRAAIAPLQEAAEHFRHANDIRALAETEYQRGWVEFDLLLEFEDARRTGEAAFMHFRAVDDELGAQRANMLIALAETNIAHEKKGNDRELRFGIITRRLVEAQRYFEAHDETTDALRALNLQAMPDTLRGRTDRMAKIYQVVRQRAHARGDRFLEAGAIQNLAYVAHRNGEMAKAASMYESVLPLIERDRNPDLYATIIGNLGYTLIALGDFDRALMLQSEALELFSARGDIGQTARTLTALGAIQFRTGNVERAYESLRSGQPLYERAGDVTGQASALRLMGNAAAELGRHDLALEHLRKAEQLASDLDTIEGTRVLIAGELRTLGDLRGAEKLLSAVLLTKNEQTRADALAERARLRRHQNRSREALADLRAADTIYARLQFDFNRIDTSAALALALLDAGDVRAAAAAADTAVTMEARIRVKSANPELRAGFLSASYAPYEARIEVDLASGPPRDPNASWSAFRTAEAIRARSLSDRVSSGSRPGSEPRDAELEILREKLTALQIDLERRARASHGEPESGALELRRRIEETRARLESRALSGGGVGTSSALTISASRTDVQAALPIDTAVLAYFVGDRRSHAWLLTRSELRHEVLPGRRVLQDLVSTFIERQRSGVRSANDAVFAPLLGNLLDGVSARRLLVLPDGPLNGLPFAALPLPRGAPRELLVDRFVITAAPSLALALRPREARTGEHLRVAVISDPVYTPDDRRLTSAASEAATFRGAGPSDDRFARLPYSAIEARAVVRAFAGMDIIELAGFNATVRRVIELPSADLGVLHFATHAVTRRDAPEQSALFLSEYAADGTPLAQDRLTADDIARSGLRADVVVLSGCATGDGRELRGEGVLGLTYRFLANGSNTVVASLWPVEDALTARFMEEFYTAYRATGRTADALRTAQLRTRGTAAAAVWSSFVVRANGLP
jgi:CHAT domain-containing protein/tetratricopeptide (TPR) repeat protein